MIKKLFRNLLTSAMLAGILFACLPNVSATEVEPDHACAICHEEHGVIEDTPSPEELRTLMTDTYSAALKKSGLRNFYNRCSTLVNTTLLCLGITNTYISCHGKGEYDKFIGMDLTDAGYRVTRYPATSYSLRGALNAISDYGTEDVYNIVLGWQSGTTSASRYYGHTCFIYGIVDGTVYFIDNFAMTIGGKYYKAGEIVTCTIDEFANYYDSWARFEGAVHFEAADLQAPVVSEYAQVSDMSSDGFTLTYEASDETRITSVYAKVWTAATGETEGYQIIDGTLEDGIATIRVETKDFDNYQGYYYVTCYTGDGSNEPSVTNVEGGNVCLYLAEEYRCYYRVSAEVANVYRVPEARVNGQSTKIGVLSQNEIRLAVATYISPDGELWLQLEEGGWVMAANLTEDLEIPTQWPDFIMNILNWLIDMGIITP